MIGFHAAAVAHVAAEAARRRMEREEEEEVNREPAGDSSAFEYKIIRSATSAFKNPKKFRVILDEEAVAGWELHEKLDDARARLRRTLDWRDRDSELTQDPYRTKVGMSEGIMALWVGLGILVGVGTIVGIMALVGK